MKKWEQFKVSERFPRWQNRDESNLRLSIYASAYFNACTASVVITPSGYVYRAGRACCGTVCVSFSFRITNTSQHEYRGRMNRQINKSNPQIHKHKSKNLNPQITNPNHKHKSTITNPRMSNPQAQSKNHNHESRIHKHNSKSRLTNQ